MNKNLIPQADRNFTDGARGFTLVELLISIAVITILAGMAAQTFRVVLDARAVSMKRIEINETGRTALEYIANDLRSAYLTPDSVKPVLTQPTGGINQPNLVPRFRFAGIYRDVEVTADSGVPGAGKDDDGDGLIDEEVLDGIDADFPGGAKTSLQGVKPVTDPRGCDDPKDPACIDEDIGLFPSDLLHFVSAIENSGELILQEISYGLNPEGTKLVRRAQILKLQTGSAASSNKTELINFGQFIDNQTGLRLVPSPAVVGLPMNPAELKAAIQNWDNGAKYGQLASQSSAYTNKNPAKLFQVLAYDIRGLRFRYWYYDYNRGGWRTTEEWDSARETALVTPGSSATGKLFNKPAANNSNEGRPGIGFENVIVNEPEDVYPRMVNNPLQFIVADPSVLLSSQDYTDVRDRILQRTDGLPNMVEIIIYVQDRDRTINPLPFTTRVFVPNNYRSIGS